jgi:hypothetical protein
MAFMTYFARRTKQFAADTAKAATQYQQQQQQQQRHHHTTSSTLRQKKEIGDYWLGKTIGRGASGK